MSSFRRPTAGPRGPASRPARTRGRSRRVPAPVPAQKSANACGAGGVARDPEHQLKGGQFRPVAGVPVQQPGGVVGRVLLPGQPLHLGPAGRVQVAVFGDLLHPEVQRVEEAPGRGQVGRVLDRWPRLGGVQRVDQQEAGALLPGHRGEVGEVGEVADAPGPGGPHGVELRGQSPVPPSGERLGGAEPPRCDDERALGHRAAVVRQQGVPARGAHGPGPRTSPGR